MTKSTEGLHYIYDEALRCEREYTEVSGEASVGDYVKYGKRIARVVEDSHGYGETLLLTTKLCDATKLAPTGNVHIDDVIYRLADRKADVGDTILITTDSFLFRHVKRTPFSVVKVNEDSGFVNLDGQFDDGSQLNAQQPQYTVLDPVESAEPAPKSTDELLANLVRRVHELERQSATHYAVNKEAEERDDLAERIQRNFNELKREMSAIKNDLQTFAEVAEDAKHQAEVLSKQAQAKRDNDRARALYNRKGGCV